MAPRTTSLYGTDPDAITVTLECTAGFYPHTPAGQMAARLLAGQRFGGTVDPQEWEELQDMISSME